MCGRRRTLGLCDKPLERSAFPSVVRHGHCDARLQRAVGGGIFSAISGADFPHGDIWYVVVLRGLASVIPGTWYANEGVDAEHIITIHEPSDVPTQFDLMSSWSAMGTLDLWLGEAAGIAMITLAIRLRRWRDEG